MAWNIVSVKVGDKEYRAQESITSTNPFFSIPAYVDIAEGDSFSSGKKTFKAIKVVDLANRGETLLVEAKESKVNDKSSKGGVSPKDSESGD